MLERRAGVRLAPDVLQKIVGFHWFHYIVERAVGACRAAVCAVKQTARVSKRWPDRSIRIRSGNHLVERRAVAR
jgi:hypothetical protein